MGIFDFGLPGAGSPPRYSGNNPVAGALMAQNAPPYDPENPLTWPDQIRQHGFTRVDPNWAPMRQFLQQLPPDMEFVPDDGGAGPTIRVVPKNREPLTS